MSVGDGRGRSLVPPPPLWGDDQSTYDRLLDEGMDATLDKRFADAHTAYEHALRIHPRGPDAAMIRGNLKRLRDLMRTSSPR